MSSPKSLAKKQIAKQLLTSKPAYQSKPLILTGESGAHKNPYEKWKSDVDRFTPKGWAPTMKETGCPVEIGGPFSKDADYSRNMSFPPEFCPMCGETADPQTASKGLFIFNHGYPEIGVRQYDRAIHYTCAACIEEMVFPTRPAIETPESELCARRQEWAWQAEERMVEYVKAQRSIGVTGRIFGSESRRERFKDADNKEL